MGDRSIYMIASAARETTWNDGIPVSSALVAHSAHNEGFRAAVDAVVRETLARVLTHGDGLHHCPDCGVGPDLLHQIERDLIGGDRG